MAGFLPYFTCFLGVICGFSIGLIVGFRLGIDSILDKIMGKVKDIFGEEFDEK